MRAIRIDPNKSITLGIFGLSEGITWQSIAAMGLLPLEYALQQHVGRDTIGLVMAVDEEAPMAPEGSPRLEPNEYATLLAGTMIIGSVWIVQVDSELQDVVDLHPRLNAHYFERMFRL